MNSKRVELGSILKTLVGNSNVYFQPPETIKLSYPCVIYNLDGVNQSHANDYVYKYDKRYIVTFISKDPDNTYFESLISAMKHVRFDRRFIADNLYHDVFTVYY